MMDAQISKLCGYIEQRQRLKKHFAKKSHLNEP